MLRKSHAEPLTHSRLKNRGFPVIVQLCGHLNASVNEDGLKCALRMKYPTPPLSLTLTHTRTHRCVDRDARKERLDQAD